MSFSTSVDRMQIQQKDHATFIPKGSAAKRISRRPKKTPIKTPGNLIRTENITQNENGKRHFDSISAA